MASVAFSVDCRGTQPGKSVFVCGSHESLGGWQPSRALALTTTKEAFPSWTCAPVPVPAGEAIEYKFLVQHENLAGTPAWEDFKGNRSIVPSAGREVTARCVWGSAQSTTTTTPLSGTTDMATSYSPPCLLSQAAEELPEGGCVEVKEDCPMAAAMEKRELVRRNFSQSLIGVDDEEGEVDASEEEEPVARAASTPKPVARGANLCRLQSFSALTEVLHAEEKAEARKSGTEKAQKQYDPLNKHVPVVIVTSEISPWSKTGGLGLVAASYGYEFARNGHRCMAIAPLYKRYAQLEFVGETRVMVNGQEELVKYWHRFMDYGEGCGTDYVFVDHPSLVREGGLYNGDDGREYPDNLFRFTLLSLAAMEAPLILNIRGSKYGDNVLFLANDWQAGLVPLYLCHKYRRNGCYQQSRCIYVVHNLGYQGQYHGYDGCHFFGIEPQALHDITMGDCVNLCKGALICSDRVITVSPNYMKEVQTPQGGFRLQDFCCAKGQRLYGILNGIDDCWNPESDHNIHKNYGVENFVEAKRENKLALQRKLGLREDDGAVMIGFVGRLTWQKGVDVLGSIIGWLMEDSGNGVNGRIQLVMMGNGEKQYAEALQGGERAYPGRVCGYVGFDPKVEHQIMAGADLFLMPSRYEPCGLPQMISQQYGTLPVVTATGGLVDSVVDVSRGIDRATGFQMPHLEEGKMKEVLYGACEMYLKRPGEFRRMQTTAMHTDFYWPRAVDEYERQIDLTLGEPPIVR